MKENPRRAFFDGIAELWDGWEEPSLRARIDAGLEELDLRGRETVLDVGCGTGNLTAALLERLDPDGRVIALDISPAMLAVARRKIEDPRVDWRCDDVARLPLPDASVDRVLCYTVWPHLDDPAAVAVELWRVLRPGGWLHVWHLIGRARVNEIHASAGAAVQGDVLPPAEETARVLRAQGFEVTAVIDEESRYLVSALRPAGG